MQKILTVLVVFLCLSAILPAQNLLFSLSGSYGLFTGDYEESKAYDTYGLMFGAECRIGKHFTAGNEVQWQFFEPEDAVLYSYKPAKIPAFYFIERRITSVRPGVRWYPAGPFKGFFLGVYGTGNYLVIMTSAYPESPDYYFEYKDPDDYIGLGAGLMAGFRLKLANKLKVSAQGNYDVTRYDAPNYIGRGPQIWLSLSLVI